MSENIISKYKNTLIQALDLIEDDKVDLLVEHIFEAHQNMRRIFICGNGGSAANALHIANDLLYGVNPNGRAINIEALPANVSVLTCLGNDLGYDEIFSSQLKTKALPKDILITMSGSGNSPNILKALEYANRNDITTWSILGYSGGKAKHLSQHVMHFEIDDMQVSEDIQLILGHILMKSLYGKIN